MAIPLHILGGYLGVGKTTLVSQLLRSAMDRVAIIVNDVGKAAIDASMIEGGFSLTSINGGCVCCTAPAGLTNALKAILDDVRPDRIYIEPSGLARPADLVDMIERSPDAARVRRMPLTLVVDPRRPDGAPLDHEQWEGAEILVINRCDEASADELTRVRARAAAHWPPLIRVIETSWGRVAPADLEGPSTVHPHTHDHGPSTDGYSATSRILDRATIYSLNALLSAVRAEPALVRFKGLFRTDAGWIRLDVAGGTPQVNATSWRTDSRYDAIFQSATVSPTLVPAVDRAVATPGVPGSGLRLIDASSAEQHVSVDTLKALRGQVADVSALVPGRVGSGVYLRDVLRLLEAAPEDRFVVAAGDGMIAAPCAVQDVGDAILVHSLSGEALPGAQGGPIRLLTGPGQSACANVKQVVSIRIVPSTLGAP